VAVSDGPDDQRDLAARIARLKAALAARDAELAARDAELSARDAELSARDAELAARDGELAARAAELTERSAELAERSAELAEQAAKMQFLDEECTPHVRDLVRNGLEAGESGAGPRSWRFEFNRFEIAFDLDRDEVVIEDVLDPAEAGAQRIPIAEFSAALTARKT